MTSAAETRSRLKYGTLRSRDADLGRLQLGLNLRAIRVAEGVRAALACAAVIMASEWLQMPALVYMALAAFFTCLCDTGGPIRQRLPRLVTFTVAGGLIWSGLGLLRHVGLAYAIPVAALGIFVNSFVRIWGQGATAVGNILSIVVILSLDQSLAPAQAGIILVMFLAGGAWAILLMIVIWRLHPYQQARAAQADVWRKMAALAADLLVLSQQEGPGTTEWEQHARAHRRAVREQIETARGVIMDTVGMRGQLSLRGSQALLRLEAGDAVFGTLIALSHQMEAGLSAASRLSVIRLLRVLQPALTVLSRSMLTDHPLRPGQVENAIARMERAAAAAPELAGIMHALATQLRNAERLGTREGYTPGGPIGRSIALPLRERLIGPAMANLTWQSAMFRHAVRTAVIATPALAVTLAWDAPFAHWLPITVVVTLQPFYAATWQRALERVGGTIIGGFIGALLALVSHQPIVLAGFMVPLCIIAFAARQVSFGTFIAGITPLIIVLMELLHPGHSSWEVAGYRAAFTLAGGALAVLGWLALWPSWEPARLRGELQAALHAHAAFARAVFDELAGPGSATATEAARRQAGVLSNNVEASLTRALQEPGHDSRSPLEAAMVVDATLRRVAGQLSAIRHDRSLRQAPVNGSLGGWRDRVADALDRLADNRDPAAQQVPSEAMPESVARLFRQVTLIEGAARRYRLQADRQAA